VNVKFTPTARQRARIITTWWRKHRPGAEHTFEHELEHVARKLAAMSGESRIGIVFRETRRNTIWRVLMPKSEQWIYYAVDVASDLVVIRSIWGARRGRDPKL
jgi:hypothetical protein